ncbi:hypothetical protein F4V91_25465 [Neorhizobium galegae]|uniref:Uncharacterized protein n=1 Tax=Neorhizobium galegae TaxID=399 RepID=A0A6A1TID4_NEOGA|nr:hypothetical protein F4V91_25465 [Neorhizobium galegae]
MVPARSSRHGISCSRHLSRSQAEIPLILAVQISRATSLFQIPRHDISSGQHRELRTAAMSLWAKIAQA